jgi:hypothetical protein
MRTKKKTDAPKSCEECARWNEVKRKIRISKLLANAIAAFEAKLKGAQLKPTIAEYLKLVQMEHEIEEGAPKDITVRWIEPEPPQPMSKEE